jgi:Lon protease-like protein
MIEDTRIPLFPLSAHLLPGGRMSLKIFETRYIRMIKEACAADTGFGMCMLNSQGDKAKNQHIYSIGTHAKVVDFDILDDGLLGVTVAGDKCFKIVDVFTDSDGLRRGKVEWLESWEQHQLDIDIQPIDLRLKEIFDKYPDIQSLYDTPQFSDPIWVIYRWLEILPVEAEKKQLFLQQKDCMKALSFLTQLVE